MANFQKIKLADVADVIDSLHITPIYSATGYPMVRVTDIKPGFLKTDNCLKVAKDIFLEFSRKHKAKKGDIIFSRVGSEGIVSLVAEDSEFCLGQNTAFIVPKEQNNFLYYWLNSPIGVHEIKTKTTGATQRTVSLVSIRTLNLSIPSISDQEDISSVLSAYDNLIENNEKRIKVLEEMAQLLYIEWFVKTEKILEITELGTKIDIKKGKNITLNTITHGNVPVVAGGLSPAYYHNKANTLAPIITISASGANAGFVNLYYENIWASDCSFIDKSTTPFLYFYYLFLKNNQTEITKSQRGSAQPHVYPDDLMRLKIADVSADLLKKFEDKVEIIFNNIKNIKRQNQNASQIRDLLIPQLVTGKRELK